MHNPTKHNVFFIIEHNCYLTIAILCYYNIGANRAHITIRCTSLLSAGFSSCGYKRMLIIRKTDEMW